jgi:pimeloyl-ACP methyl ester carboxylesterase
MAAPQAQAESGPTALRVASADGTPIHVSVAGQGRPLVLVHGTTADHTRWNGIMPALAAKHRVYAMDRRGRGLSGDGQPYSAEREFEDVAAVIARAARDAGGPVDVLGHSFGGFCALGAALRSRDIRRLALYEPPFLGGAPPYAPGFLERIDALVAAGRPEEALLVFFRELALVSEDQLARMRRTAVWEARITAADTIVREARAEEAMPFGTKDVARLRLPVLLLQGGDSPPFLKDAIRALDQAIPGSVVATMPGQQHAAMDSAPEMFLREVEGFLLAP